MGGGQCGEEFVGRDDQILVPEGDHQRLVDLGVRVRATIGKRGYEEMLVAGIVADVANGASGRGTRYDEIVAVQVTEDAFEPGADEGPLMPLGDDDFTALRHHFGMNLRTFASLFLPTHPLALSCL